MLTDINHRSRRPHWFSSILKAAGDLSFIEKSIAAAIAVCVIFQFHLLLVQKINWDEYYFLSMVHEFQRGELARALQTFHVHLFGWLGSLDLQEVDQVISARIVMWLCELGTLGGIFVTARALLSRQGALISVLTYVSITPVLIHGASFRADPLAAFLMMICFALVARADLRGGSLIGLVLAASLAALVTVKVVFFAPALIGLAVWRLTSSADQARLALRMMMAGVGAVAVFAALYFWHQGLMPQANLAGSGTMMSSAYKTTIVSGGLVPRADVLTWLFFTSMPQTLLVIFGLVTVCVALVKRDTNRVDLWVLVLLATPLLSFLFYRNAFVYFIPFILPPAVILAGYGFDALKVRDTLRFAAGFILLASVTTQYFARLPESKGAQQETIAAVHQMFPGPVSYIDRCSMISSYPKVGLFMSGWGLKNYLQAGVPVFEEIMSHKVVPLLIANSPVLVAALSEPDQSQTSDSIALLPEDAQALRRNFIHHWGALWVAGKRVTASSAPAAFRMEIPGPYTLEAPGAVYIDERLWNPGDVVRLTRGPHTVRATGPATVTFRWGHNLYRPQIPAPSTPLFTGF